MKNRGFPPVYKIERVAKMSVKRAFFGIFQKLTLFCCAMFFGFADAFSANLPSGYTELEYIKSSNNAFLDTGYILQSDNIKYEWEAIDAAGSSSSLFGSETSTNPKYSGILHGIPSSRALYVGSSTSLNVGYTTDTTSFHSWVLDITSAGKASLYKDGTKTATANWTVPVQKSLSIYIFSNHSEGQYANNVSLKYFKITDNNVLKVNLVPAQRNSDSKVGMYDLVSNKFITNSQGSLVAGPVVLNPCRNLFDGVYPNPTGAPKYKAIYVGEGTFTCSYSMPHNDSNTSMVYFLPGNVSSGANNSQNQVDATHPRTVTAVDGYVTIAYRNGTDISMGNAVPSDYHAQIERGATATDYVPYCEPFIKIATTAYNAARFNPVQTDLNSAVATIRDIVTKTINQTAAIASLQADKQTRPEDACPAGKKCLLVEDNNGKPHWFPIIENICGVPSGYTCLDYIQASGTQYIDTGIVPTLTSGAQIRVKFLALKDADNVIFGATDSTAYAGGSPFSIDVFTNRVLMPFGGGANNSVNYSPMISKTMETNVLYDFKLNYLNDKKASVNDTQVTYSNPVSMTSRSLLLFNLNSSGGGVSQYAATKSQMFSAVITNGSNIVFNGVPAKRDSDGVIGVYDTVSDRFLTNAGTGTFTAGPEI